MEQKSDDEVTIRRYLLGDLPEEERQQLECRMLSDSECFGYVSILEEELVDQYVCGMLTVDELQKFELYFLTTPEGNEQVRLAANLREYALSAAAARSPKPSLADSRSDLRQISLIDYLRSGGLKMRLAIAAAVVLLTVAGAAVNIKIWQLQEQIDKLRAQQASPTLREQELQKQLAEQQSRSEQLAAELQREQEQRNEIEQELTSLKNSNPQQAGSTVVSIFLTSGRVRGGGGSKELIIGSSVKRVSFHLAIGEADYSSYRASLHAGTGEEVWRGQFLKAQSGRHGREVQLNVPVTLLPPGDYFLILQGTTNQRDYEDVGTYYFEVVKI